MNAAHYVRQPPPRQSEIWTFFDFSRHLACWWNDLHFVYQLPAFVLNLKAGATSRRSLQSVALSIVGSRSWKSLMPLL
jgi:hypothetical protein